MYMVIAIQKRRFSLGNNVLLFLNILENFEDHLQLNALVRTTTNKNNGTIYCSYW